MQAETNITVRVTVEVIKALNSYDRGTLAKAVCEVEGTMDLEEIPGHIATLANEAVLVATRQFNRTVQIKELEEQQRIALLRNE